MTPTVGIVADDLTGANDTAVQFAVQGWVTLLSLRPLAPQVVAGRKGVGAGDVEVIAVTTDSRASGDGAAASTETAVEDLVAAGISRLYVKIDSTMRGSVAAQVRGALESWTHHHPQAFAVVCPAYPEMGRTVVDAVVGVDGEPLEDGPAGADPVTPVTTSLLSELLPGSVHVPAPDSGDPRELADALKKRGADHRVLTADAATADDLDLVAQAVTLLGPQAVPAGSAGLATALARVTTSTRPRPPAGNPSSDPRRPGAEHRGPVVALVTSLHRTARAQQERLREAFAGRILHLCPTLDDLRDEDAFSRWRTAAPGPRDETEVVLVLAPERTPGPDVVDAGDVARRLAVVVDDVRRASGTSALVVTGGDGARAVVDLWACLGIGVQGAVREGVPRGVLVGGDADTLPIITKAGGFGDAETLVEAVRHLLAEVAPDRAVTSRP